VTYVSTAITNLLLKYNRKIISKISPAKRKFIRMTKLSATLIGVLVILGGTLIITGGYSANPMSSLSLWDLAADPVYAQAIESSDTAPLQTLETEIDSMKPSAPLASSAPSTVQDVAYDLTQAESANPEPANNQAAEPASIIPTTADNLPAVREDAAQLGQFVQQIVNGNAVEIVGVYVTNAGSFPVVQQPAGNASFVSTEAGVLTQFALATNYGSIGMLAHNYLAGNQFFLMAEGNEVVLVYGDGSTAHFIIEDIHDYQALSPTSPYSDFIDLENNAQMNSTELFYATYGQSDSLILQTCIAQGSEASWGRRFIIARPAAQYAFDAGADLQTTGISYREVPQAKYDMLEQTSY
jgi:hypothetical protein